jgi:hypothetical protein
VRFGKPWRLGLPDCYVERLDALKRYYYELSDMRADLVSIREALSSPEAQRDERPTLSDDITAAIAALECAEDRMFSLLPKEEGAECFARYLPRSCRLTRTARRRPLVEVVALWCRASWHRREVRATQGHTALNRVSYSRATVLVQRFSVSASLRRSRPVDSRFSELLVSPAVR